MNLQEQRIYSVERLLTYKVNEQEKRHNTTKTLCVILAANFWIWLPLVLVALVVYAVSKFRVRKARKALLNFQIKVAANPTKIFNKE